MKSMFERVEEGVDVAGLRGCRAFLSGGGGARQFIEDLVRCGLSQVVLVDPQRIEFPNLATQHTRHSELGMLKVEAIAASLRDINPDVRVLSLAAGIEELDDGRVAELLFERWQGDRDPPTVSLLLGCTDNFPAQARVNRLALQFGVPSLCAQLYLEGRGAEITFTYPGLTCACHRCILSGRYRAYQEGYTNVVGSARAPIFVTGRVNALKGLIALALLHYGLREKGATWPDDPRGPQRWADLALQIGNRNLALIRMDPNIAVTLGLRQFDRALAGAARPDAHIFDDVLWLEQRPEHPDSDGSPACPDCGGLGDLRSAMGTFSDTRMTPFLNIRGKTSSQVAAP